MSGTNGFDLTTLVGVTFPGLNVGLTNTGLFDSANTDPTSGVFTVTGEASNQGETRSGTQDTTFIVTAASNDVPASDQYALGSLTVQETQNGVDLGGTFVLNVVAYTANSILTGNPANYQATTGYYDTYYILSDVNIGLHKADDPTPPVFPQTFTDPTDAGYAPPCFAAGTPILTPDGERPVEHLRAGDQVLTAAGDTATIRWVGHRAVTPRGADAEPVRIAAHAFGPDQPHCPITLSPDHAVFEGGVLVPIHLLVDGIAITRAPQPRITYHHVELDRHDVLLAAGLPAESYLDTGNRRAFCQGDDGVVSLYPDFLALGWEAACAPLVLHGAALDAVRAKLATIRLANDRPAKHRPTQNRVETPNHHLRQRPHLERKA